jgi:hypothetical protein
MMDVAHAAGGIERRRCLPRSSCWRGRGPGLARPRLLLRSNSKMRRRQRRRLDDTDVGDTGSPDATSGRSYKPVLFAGGDVHQWFCRWQMHQFMSRGVTACIQNRSARLVLVVVLLLVLLLLRRFQPLVASGNLRLRADKPPPVPGSRAGHVRSIVETGPARGDDAGRDAGERCGNRKREQVDLRMRAFQEHQN